MDGVHDLGGVAGFGRVDADAVSSGAEGWEARSQVVALLSGGGRRAGIEQIPPERYLTSSYSERWLLCAERRLVDGGVISQDDLDLWVERFTADPATEMPCSEDSEAAAWLVEYLTTTPQLETAEGETFRVGDRVRVRRMRPRGHHRCPRYVRGVIGEIERVPGTDKIPADPDVESGREPVYTVRFESRDIWGEGSEPAFELLIDLWQSYLEVP